MNYSYEMKNDCFDFFSLNKDMTLHELKVCLQQEFPEYQITDKDFQSLFDEWAKENT